jgi:hypothetical protein
LNLFVGAASHRQNRAILAEDSPMTGIEIVAKLAERQKRYDDAHRPTRLLEAYRRRHARRHPKLDFDGQQHVPQYRAWS